MKHGELEKLPDDVARKVLARAAELDATDYMRVSIPDLRNAAVEAGISSRALEQALREITSPAPPADSAAPAVERKPRFLRRKVLAIAALILVLLGLYVLGREQPAYVEYEQAETPAPGR